MAVRVCMLNMSSAAPIGHCNLLRYISILSPFTVPLSVLPFVMRVSALYSNNKFVVVFFSMTWLLVLGAHVLVPIDTYGGNIGTTKYCLVLRTKMVNMLTSSSVFIHDLLIFIATSWGFMRNSYSDVNVENSIRVMIFGMELPAFSKSMLRNGQVYFLWVCVRSLCCLFTLTNRIYHLGPPLFWIFCLLCWATSLMQQSIHKPSVSPSWWC